MQYRAAVVDLEGKLLLKDGGPPLLHGRYLQNRCVVPSSLSISCLLDLQTINAQDGHDGTPHLPNSADAYNVVVAFHHP